MNRSTIQVEVVYALPLQQDATILYVPSGTTVAQAIERSGVAGRHPEVAAGRTLAAIFGRRVPDDTVLRDQDRIELLRPLTVDPKEARRLRAVKRRSGTSS